MRQYKSMSETKLEAYFFTAVFLLTLVVVGFLFYPFIGSLALALVLAILTTPFYAHLCRYVRNKNIAAIIVTTLVALSIILPAIGIFYLLIEELRSVTQQVTVDNIRALPSFFSHIREIAFQVFPFLQTFNFTEPLNTFLQNLGAYTASAFTSTTSLLLKFFIALIAFYYFILDGKHFIAELIKLSPLDNAKDEAIIARMKIVTYSIVRGTLVIAILQGLFVGIGFLVFGVPKPVLWGSVATVCALVPTVGTSLISMPAILYLLITSQFIPAIGLFAWSVLLVGLIDNIIGPKLIGSESHMHPLFVLLSVLGGLSLFGVSGFLLGPLLFGFFIALSEIYKTKIQEIHNHSF